MPPNNVRGSAPPHEADATSDVRPASLAGRYVLEALLGEGGMGSIHRAWDDRTNRPVALKRLKLGSESTSIRRVAAFQREFHTLSDLSHPRIIRVFDYGIAESGPYYTMELLDGQDLHQLAPVPWRQACALLRDVVSSLALIHSRGLVHRDVTARNVRCTADGRAKLIDFGALTAMGLPRDTVGTPAFMSPEAAFGQPLDQRADLYSLGALAYWLLTGRMAYRATRLRELSDAWRTRPAPPSFVVADIPAELDTLVMSLLSMTPAGRPQYANEVSERLTTLAELPKTADVGTAHAYLTTPPVVNREAELLQVRKAVFGMTSGRGGALGFEGAPGSGKSRLLATLGLEGKLAGATVLRADSRDAGEDFAVAEALMRQLEQSEPMSAPWPSGRSAQERLLARLPDVGALPPSEARGAMLASLRRAMLDGFIGRGLIIMVDDLHRIDEPSLALLATMASEARMRRLLIATSRNPDQMRPSAAGELLRRSSTVIELGPFNPVGTEVLIRRMFGDAPHVQSIASHIHHRTDGNPGLCIEFAERLVGKGIVRFEAGYWHLPARLDRSVLPASREAARLARIAELSETATGLARILSLCVEQRLSLDELGALMPSQADDAELVRALDELVGALIVVEDEQGYILSDRTWADLFLPDTVDEQSRMGHRRLARILAQRKHGALLAARHWLRAGDPDPALDAVVESASVSRERSDRDPDAYSTELAQMPEDWLEIYQAVLAHCEGPERLRDRYILLARLSGFVTFFGTDSKAHMDELQGLLEDWSGLSDYERMDPSLPDSERLSRAIAKAQQRYDAQPPELRVLAPADAIRELMRTTLEVLGKIAWSLDYEAWRALPDLQPFVPLSPALAFVHAAVQGLGARISGRSELSMRHYHAGLELLARPDGAGLPPTHLWVSRRNFARAVALVEASLGLPEALERATAIESSARHRAVAQHIRVVHHLWQGDVRTAIALEQRAERLMIDNSPMQWYECSHLAAALSASALSDDLAGIRRLLDSLERMAGWSKGWAALLGYARAEQARIQGDYELARAGLEQTLRDVRAGCDEIWAQAAGSLVATLSRMGRAPEARARGLEFLAAAEQADLGLRRHYVAIPLALVEAELGQLDEARARVAAFMHELAQLGSTGILLGLAHEAAARVAIHEKDAATFESHATLGASQYRVGTNPALTARFQRLMGDARSAGLIDDDGGGSAEEYDARAMMKRITSRPPDDRADTVLKLLAEHLGGRGGFLFEVRDGHASVLASSGGRQPHGHLLQLVERHLAAVACDSIVTVTRDEETVSQDGYSLGDEIDGESYVLVPLYGQRGRHEQLVGIAALCSVTQEVHAPRPGYLRAFGEALLAMERDEGAATSVKAGGPE